MFSQLDFQVMKFVSKAAYPVNRTRSLLTLFGKICLRPVAKSSCSFVLLLQILLQLIGLRIRF